MKIKDFALAFLECPDGTFTVIPVNKVFGGLVVQVDNKEDAYEQLGAAFKSVLKAAGSEGLHKDYSYNEKGITPK